MALKTFNLDAQVYGEFSKHCKKHGISMSKKVENFIREETLKLKSGELEKKSDYRDLDLELNKETKPRMGIERKDADSNHPMGKYC